jgi:hypothetical protein
MTTMDQSNLMTHRAPQSVWDKRGWRGTTIEERLAPWLVSLGGAGLFAFSASRRSRLGMAGMAAGFTLVALATAGICSPSRVATRWRQIVRRRDEPDQVTTESMDSFPASDAPSSNATTIGSGPAAGSPPLNEAQ